MLRSYRHNRNYFFRFNRNCNFSIVKDSSNTADNLETKTPLINSTSSLISKLINAGQHIKKQTNDSYREPHQSQSSNASIQPSSSPASQSTLTSLIRRASLSSTANQQHSQINNIMNKNSVSTPSVATTASTSSNQRSAVAAVAINRAAASNSNSTNTNISPAMYSSAALVAASAAVSHSSISKIVSGKQNQMNNYINNNNSTGNTNTMMSNSARPLSPPISMNAAMSKLSSLAASLPTSSTNISNSTVVGATVNTKHNDNSYNTATTAQQQQSTNKSALFSFDSTKGIAATASTSSFQTNRIGGWTTRITAPSDAGSSTSDSGGNNKKEVDGKFTPIMNENSDISARKSAITSDTLAGGARRAGSSSGNSSSTVAAAAPARAIGLSVREALRNAQVNRRMDHNEFPNVINSSSSIVEEALSDDTNESRGDRRRPPAQVRSSGSNDSYNSNKVNTAYKAPTTSTGKGSGFFPSRTTNAAADHSTHTGNSGSSDIYDDVLKSIHQQQRQSNSSNTSAGATTVNKKDYFNPTSGYGGGEEREFYLPGVGIGVVELDEVTDGESAYLRKRDHLNRTRAAFQATLPPAGEPLPTPTAVAGSGGASSAASTTNTATAVPWTSAMNTNNNNYNYNNNSSSSSAAAAAPRVYSIAELKQLTEQTLLQKKLAFQQEQQQQNNSRFGNNNGHRSYSRSNNNTASTSSNNRMDKNDKSNNNDSPKFSFKQQNKLNRKNQQLIASRTVVKDISIPFEGLTVRELSSKLSIKVSELKGRLEALGENCNMKAAVAADLASNTNGDVDNKNNNSSSSSSKSSNNKALSAVAMNALLEEKLKSKVIDADVAELVALELGLNVTRLKAISNNNSTTAASVTTSGKSNHKLSSLSDTATEAAASASVELLPRAPIVCIMGHVDHGKTTLLDYLRSANVASGEAGGITQKLSAFSVTMKQQPQSSVESESADVENDKEEEKAVEKKVVFLDTPGHAAFSAMRINGASATDVVVLVVAIDDGVRPQTIEAIEAARESQCTVIIALNKIDKIPIATERITARSKVLSQLADLGVVCEEFGGDVLVVEVSGRSGEGIDTLVESLALQTEVLDLKAPVTGCFAEATVLDACVEKGRGIIANVLVRWGSLAVGDSIVVGTAYGKIKALLDIDTGESVTSVGPSTPVKLIGLRSVPLTGQELITVPNEGRAKDIADRRLRVYDLKKARMQESCLQALYASTGSGTGEADSSAPVMEHVSHRAMKPKKFGALPEPVASKASDSDSNNSISIDDIALSLEKLHNNTINNNSSSKRKMMNKVNVLLKADGPGTLSALEKVISELIALCANDIQVTIINSSVGDVVQSDIERLSTVKGAETCILGFNIGVADSSTRAMAKEFDVKIVRNTIIYRLEDELRSIMESVLPRECTLVKMGEARVKQVFAMTGKSEGVVAGLMVESGHLKLSHDKSDKSGGSSDKNKNSSSSSTEKGGGTQYIYRIMRGGSVVSGGERLEATTLKKFKENVTSVEVGSECGLTIEKFKAYEVDDMIECYKVEWRNRTLTTTSSAATTASAKTQNNHDTSTSSFSSSTASNNHTSTASRNNNNNKTGNNSSSSSSSTVDGGQQKQQKISH